MANQSAVKVKSKIMKKSTLFSPSDIGVPNKFLVNEVGEIEKMLYPGDTAKITSVRQKEYLSSTTEWKPREYVIANAEELRLVLPELDAYEKAFLGAVQPYIGFRDCLLKVQTESGPKDVIFRDLLRIVGFGKTKLTEVVESLQKRDIVYVGKNSKNNQYFINPWLYNRGARINKVLASMFQNYRILSMGGVKWKDLNR